MTASAARRTLWALAAVNLVFFGGWIAREEHARRTHTVRLPVEGYDPRDLLSGHYVQFRLRAETEAQALVGGVDEGGAVDLCLEAGADGLQHVVRVARGSDGCAAGFVRARRTRGGAVRVDVDRFYVPEARAGAVARVAAGPRTYLLATLDAQGGVHVVDLVVEGVSVRGP